MASAVSGSSDTMASPACSPARATTSTSRQRFVAEYGLSEYDADVLTQLRERSRYFEAAIRRGGAPPKILCNWITTELLGRLKDAPLAEAKVKPEQVADLARLITTHQAVAAGPPPIPTRPDELAESDAAVTTHLIALYKSLGGGWEEARPALASAPAPAGAARP